MLKKINLVVFVGLAISGFFIFFDFLLSLIYPTVTVLAKFAVAAVFTGWFFGATAVILFLIGSIQFLSGHMEDYWNSLYPVNLGLTIVGLSSFVYNPGQHPLVWIVLAFIFAIIAALFLHKLNLIKYKMLLPALTALLFINDWSGFIGGIIFITLGFLSGVSKTILVSFQKR